MKAATTCVLVLVEIILVRVSELATQMVMLLHLIISGYHDSHIFFSFYSVHCKVALQFGNMCYRGTVRSIPLSGILASDVKKFKLYCLYAWGIPFIVSTTTLVLHLLPEQSTYSHIIRPGFGELTCWFAGQWILYVGKPFYYFFAMLVYFVMYIC